MIPPVDTAVHGSKTGSEAKQRAYIIISVLLCAGAMSFIDGFIKPEYAIKSIIKIALFLLAPMVYFVLYRKEAVRLKALFQPKPKELLSALGLGLGVFGAILACYFLLRGTVDFSGVTFGAGINSDNFIAVALYISFINSLLEEFFFRGFAFIIMKGHVSRWVAYAFSSALFALYHLGMTAGWFSPAIWLLALAGLFIGGCIFNRLDEKSGNIFTSWLVHMFANFAINTIGFIMLGPV